MGPKIYFRRYEYEPILTVLIKIIIEWAVDRSTNHSELA